MNVKTFVLASVFSFIVGVWVGVILMIGPLPKQTTTILLPTGSTTIGDVGGNAKATDTNLSKVQAVLPDDKGNVVHSLTFDDSGYMVSVFPGQPYNPDPTKPRHIDINAYVPWVRCLPLVAR